MKSENDLIFVFNNLVKDLPLSVNGGLFGRLFYTYTRLYVN